MQKTAYEIGVSLALEDLEKIAAWPAFLKNLRAGGKASASRKGFDAWKQKGGAGTKLQESATDTAAFQKIRSGTAEQAHTDKLLHGKPSTTTTKQTAAAKAKREAQLRRARQQFALQG